MNTKHLGIDAGSVSASIALIGEDGKVIYSAYAFHKGEVEAVLGKMLGEIDLSSIASVGYTSSASAVVKSGTESDSRVAFISAAKHFYPKVDALLIIGAERFGLATFDKNGNYRNYRSNSACAAGTGNFLDQQAERLNIGSIQEFSRVAFESEGEFPKIASRCAVFAKTDLIHAQQEGYSLGQICDGLSYGVARNIVDVVLQDKNFSNVVIAGGVALNKAVVSHISTIIDLPVTVDEHSHIYGAIGAALVSIKEGKKVNTPFTGIDDILKKETREKIYHYPPLQLKLSDYPDFGSHTRYEYSSTYWPAMKPVEVDAYIDRRDTDHGRVFLGIDIGSTSTKAVLINPDREVIAGFYTRTAGQPVNAIQVIFEAIVEYGERFNLNFTIAGAGTTGSGRKFTGKIIGADVVLDEITAHARAAFELNPDTDTIIEIGGQDSKFTIMRNGMVTFSVMNNVCAAGTGSFIEEQAKRLGCRLEEYADRASAVESPRASDRCTVFMERDLNHYMKAGYSTDEILAAVLHSTRENYLTKVAVTGYIGNNICFQGATAKNRALVAAFEQKLGKAISVSHYCHLTGALGVALELHEKMKEGSSFKGLDLYRKRIPVRTEVCELCTNHCKLKIAEIDGTSEAYGFLCGRDYNVKKYVKRKAGEFQLMHKRDELFRYRGRGSGETLTLGLPASLHLYEDLLFWRKFFGYLNIKTVTSESYNMALKTGKHLAGAEFCAPIAAMHGHVDWLRERCDYIFLPAYFNKSGQEKSGVEYCYYTQFVTSVISVQKKFEPKEKILSPILMESIGDYSTRLELFRMLGAIGFHDTNFVNLTLAYEKARESVRIVKEKWQALYSKETQGDDDIHVMLLGRPYTVLSSSMNNSIPEIIEKQGIKTFYMDMLQYNPAEITKAEDLIRTIRWKFASRILSAAEVVAKTKGAYPVLITSFKCTPDAFVMEYFKEILDAWGKPYLILQLDEHDSAVGYETRIESAIRSFRNHNTKAESIVSQNAAEAFSEKPDINEHIEGAHSWQEYIRSLVNEASDVLKSHGIDFKRFSSVIQQVEESEEQFTSTIFSGVKNLKEKTLLLPDWDPYVSPLLEALLRSNGINAQLVHGSDDSTQRSLSYNTGQCLPLNIIVQNAIDYIEANNMDPSTTALWIMKADLSCNISMFPPYMKKLLEAYGKGMEKASVYVGDVVFYDISLTAALNAYLVYMFGGFIRKMSCNIRPYEKEEGATDRVAAEAIKLLYDAFLKGKPDEVLISKIIKKFEAIPVERVSKPKVAVFGDIYVRDNDLMNQNLVRMVEKNGGEMITTPYSEYIKIIADPLTNRNLREGRYINYAKMKFLKSLIPLTEEKYIGLFSKYNGKDTAITSKETDEWLGKFGLTILQRGEAMENILKIRKLMLQYPDIDLFIHTNPSYCCPSMVTEAMTARIEELTGIPVLTIEYDGTAGLRNDDVIPYLKYRRKK